MDLLTRVNCLVASEYESDHIKQMPVIQSTLTRLLYLEKFDQTPADELQRLSVG